MGTDQQLARTDRGVGTDTAVAAALAALFILTACGGGAGADSGPPETTETNSTSAENGDDDAGAGSQPSDTEEPEPTPIPASSEGPAQNWPAPEPDPAIHEPTEDGAEAALEYWWDARSYARNTGDTEPLEAASHEECEHCEATLESIEEAYEHGWWAQEQDVILDAYTRLEDEGLASGLFRVIEGEFTGYVDGEIVARDEAQPAASWSVTYKYNDSRWSVREFRFLDFVDDHQDVDDPTQDIGEQ